MTRLTVAFDIAGVSKAFGATTALDKVDLAVAAGSIHGLVGGNGAGKSTLMKIIAGVHRPDGGAIRLFGDPYEPRSPLEARRAGVAMIPQDLSTVPDMSVADNVMLGRWPSRRFDPRRPIPSVDTEAVHRTAARHIASLGVAIDPRARVGALSFAERQAVVIARAVACDARLLIFDEPTAALADHEAAALLALIPALRGRGVTVLYVSHRLAEIEALCDRVTVLKDGRVVAALEKGRYGRTHLEAAIAGPREASPPAPRRPDAGALPRLEAHDDAHPIFEVRLRPGQILGLHGLLGSGIGRWLASLFGAPGRRRLKVDGRDVTVSSTAQAVALGLGYVPSERGRAIVPALSVRDNILLPHLDRLSGRVGLRDRALDRAAAALMGALDIRPNDMRLPAGSLSGGNQQKVLFARWMVGAARVLLLDEPMHGIDVGAKALIGRMIDRFARDGGSVIMHSIEFEDLTSLADEVRTMERSSGKAAGAEPAEKELTT